MADNQLILRTADLFITPVPSIELERLGSREDIVSEKTERDTGFKKNLLRSEVDPLAGDSIFFGGRLSDNSDHNERKYLKRELCSELAAKCPDDEAENLIWNTVWRVFLRDNIKIQVGLFRFCGPQKKGRVGFELVIFPEFRHMGYAGQLISKMTAFAFSRNDVYYLYSRIPGNEEPENLERILRRSGFMTEEEMVDPFAAERYISDEEIINHKIPETLIKEAGVTAYSAAYVMIGLCFGMIISIFSGLMLEGLAGGLILSTVFGAIMDHLELKHRKRILTGEEDPKKANDKQSDT